MFENFNSNLSSAAVKKAQFLKESPLRYILASMYAGIFIGLGILLTSKIGAGAEGIWVSITCGLSFSVSLSFVIFTGVELFTGNNAVMAFGLFNGRTGARDMVKVWIYSYVGNLIGALLLSALFVESGLGTDAVTACVARTAEAKVGAGFMPLLCRGILCNFMVCLAVMICSNLKNEVSKFFIIIMCIYPFVTTGYEHCVANMTTFGVGLISSKIDLTVGQVAANLVPVTIGNIIGGALALAGGFYLLNNNEKRDL